MIVIHYERKSFIWQEQAILFVHNIVQADEALEEFRATSMSTSKVITRWIHLT